jgi:cell division protein FtsQ
MEPSPEGTLPAFRGPVGIQARRRRIRSILLSVAGLLLVAAAAFAVSRSAIFSLRHLRIDGNHQIVDARVERMAGLTSSTNVIWLSPAAVQRRLLANPWIASAAVTRSLPSGLTITIGERRAVAVATLDSAGPVLLAADGTVLGPAVRATRLPTIELPSNLTLTSGSRVPKTTPILRVAAAFPVGLAGRIATVKVGTAGIELETRDGVRVIYGDSSQTLAKASALDAVLVWIEQHHVIPAYIDVSAPEAPAVMPKDALVTGTPGAASTVGGVQIVAVPGVPSGAGTPASPTPSPSTSPTP